MQVIERSDSGWWRGTVSDGRIGWFPAEYVEEKKTQRHATVTIVTTPKEATLLATAEQVGLFPVRGGKGRLFYYCQLKLLPVMKQNGIAVVAMATISWQQFAFHRYLHCRFARHPMSQKAFKQLMMTHLLLNIAAYSVAVVQHVQ